MKWIAIIEFCLVLSNTAKLVLSNADFDEMESQLCECHNEIYCLLGEYDTSRTVIMSGSEMFIKKSFEWYKEISGYPPPPEDTDAYWSNYQEYLCKFSRQERDDIFLEWISRIYGFWSKVCKNEADEECVKLKAVFSEYNKMLLHYNKRGYCNGISGNMPASIGQAPKVPVVPSIG